MAQQSLPLTSENAFVVENVALAGIGKEASIPCYVRSECRRLWEFLENPKTWKFIVGCPGVGKSIIALAYVMHWIQSEVNRGKSLVYIHSNTAIRQAFTVDSTGHCLKFTFTNDKEMLEFADKMCYGRYDMTVVDGTTSDLIKPLLTNRKPNHHLIVCTSFQAINLNSESRHDVQDHYDKFTMLSWTIDDYENAKTIIAPRMFDQSSSSSTLTIPATSSSSSSSSSLTTSILYSDNDILEEISRRFYYGGGSIRWFLGDIKVTKLTIADMIFKVGDPSAILIGSVGDASRMAVNSLMAIYGHRPSSIIVSHYAFKQLFQKCSMQFVEAARRVMANNPSWQGWITELEVILKLQSSEKIEAWDKNGKVTVYENKSITDFSDEDDLLVASSYIPMSWLVPRKWNQACFDLIQIATHNEIIVFQVTSGEKHDYKLNHLIPIVNALKVSKVSFVTLCRRRNFSEFTVRNITGLEELELVLKNNYEESKCRSKIDEHFKHEILCYEEPVRAHNPNIKVSRKS